MEVYPTRFSGLRRVEAGHDSQYGVPGYIRSDNGPEFIATKVQQWLREARVVIADSRQHYNRERPHSRLGDLSPEGFIQTKILTP